MVTRRVTRIPQLKLPDGWKWSDYSVPRVENSHTGARIEFAEIRQPSCETMRVGRAFVVGDVPDEVRRIFAQRNRDIGPHATRAVDAP